MMIYQERMGRKNVSSERENERREGWRRKESSSSPLFLRFARPSSRRVRGRLYPPIEEYLETHINHPRNIDKVSSLPPEGKNPASNGRASFTEDRSRWNSRISLSVGSLSLESSPLGLPVEVNCFKGNNSLPMLSKNPPPPPFKGS